MRQDHVVEGTLPAKHHEVGSSQSSQRKDKGKKKNYPPCEHYGKIGHPPFRCWRRPYAKWNKCNQLGHEAVICKGNFQQHEVNAKVVEQDEEDQTFVTTFSTRASSECWLIDSGYTNHMTYDKILLKDLKLVKLLKVKIGNGDYISAKGKGTIVISTSSGMKTISDVLYVPNID